MNRDELISDARKLLEDLGMDAERSNERSAMTLLALAHVGDGDSWRDSTGNAYTTRAIMDWIRDRLGQEYAANTRETIRRFTLHQFIAGGIVEENADCPSRPNQLAKVELSYRAGSLVGDAGYWNERVCRPVKLVYQEYRNLEDSARGNPRNE